MTFRMSTNFRQRHPSDSSSASLEEGELINEEEFKPESRGPPPSGRSNANLWRDMILEQTLEEQMKTGPTIKGDKECTNRGTETYELPKFEEMDPEEVAKQQEVVNESLRRVSCDRLFVILQCSISGSCNT